MTVCTLNTFSQDHWALHNHYFILFCYVIVKFATFATGYGDVLCIVLSYKIASKLQSIIDHLESSLNLHLAYTKNSSKHVAEITTVKTNYGLHSSWQMIYNEIIKIRKLTIKTSKFLSPVLLISLMVDLFNIVYYVSYKFKYYLFLILRLKFIIKLTLCTYRLTKFLIQTTSCFTRLKECQYSFPYLTIRCVYVLSYTLRLVSIRLPSVFF